MQEVNCEEMSSSEESDFEFDTKADKNQSCAKVQKSKVIQRGPLKGKDFLCHKNKSRNICSYKGCNNTKRKNPHMAFHRFPFKDKSRCIEWAIATGDEKLRNTLDTKTLKSKFICEDHFLAKNYKNWEKKLLIGISIPILYSTKSEERCDITATDENQQFNIDIKEQTVNFHITSLSDDSSDEETPSNEEQSSKNSYKCGTCGTTFSCKSYLDRHMLQHSQERTFHCSICNKRFKTKAILKEHIQAHAKNNEVQCTYCGAKFKYKSSLSKHMGRAHPEKVHKFVCDICGKGFIQMVQFSKHMNMHFDGKLPMEKHNKTQKAMFKCGICEKTFIKRNRTRHMLKHERKCLHCEATFQSKFELRQHTLLMHKYKCDICQKKFVKTESLNLHMAKHIKIFKYVCDKCDQGFSNREKFDEHLKIHLKNLRCVICDKEFSSDSNLKKHFVVHLHDELEDGNYKCDICSKVFYQKSTLKCHLLLHKRREIK